MQLNKSVRLPEAVIQISAVATMASTNTNIITLDSPSNHLLLTPLLTAGDTVPGVVNFKQIPAVRSNTGRWRSAAFIIGVEMSERIAYYGVSGNLINYMTEKLGQSTAMAAANVNAWNGVALIFPVLGAIIADSFLGKYYTIIASSLLYILGLGLLTMSAMLPSRSCERSIKDSLGCLHDIQNITFFFALYLVAIGQSGHKPCVQAFGADQFDGEDPVESKAKSSFFNWWYVGLWTGSLLGIGVLSYVQDNLSWGLGFGIPSIIMVVALLIFGLGTLTYRYPEKKVGRSAFFRIGRVFFVAARNWNSVHLVLDDKNKTQSVLPNHESEQFR